MSVRIVNSRGIPGTLGCLARTVHQHRPVFLTSCHVLFAAGALRHDSIWQVREAAGRRDYLLLGSALQGKRGIVRYRGEDYFVDCAIGALEAPLQSEFACAPDSHAAPKSGDRVVKTGAATGTTTGIIIDVSYPGSRQLLIRSTGSSVSGETGRGVSYRQGWPLPQSSRGADRHS